MFVVLLICFVVVWNDLIFMCIFNLFVVVIFVVFVVLGFIVLLFEIYFWCWLYLVVFLIIGMIVNVVGLLGVGDVKFIVVVVLFFVVGDV